uniref:Protein kinase domain-containing protein n=3 Tax=Caenorhabditis tropicalis TaxID=1561998 RepID=A0A1I7U7F4_9PELO
MGILLQVLKYIDCFATGDMISIVTEEVPFTFGDVIRDKSRPKTDELNRWYHSQILSGIAYIHSKDIMHRDMKPENILVTLRNVIKIADFGQACIYLKNNADEEYDENVATRWYRAPELLFGSRKYGPSVDIWAIGCILAELVRGKPIFPGRSELEQISVIFGVLGTPNETNWPKWRTMPDANKLLFEPKEPRNNWAEICEFKKTSKKMKRL